MLLFLLWSQCTCRLPSGDRGVSNVNQAGFESSEGKNYEQQWTWKQRRGRRKKSERSRDGLRKNVLEAEAEGGREMFTSAHSCRAHVCVSKPLVMYSRLQWWTHPSPITFLTLWVHQQFRCWQTSTEPLHNLPPLLFWKWTGWKMNLPTRQHKSKAKEPERKMVPKTS